MFVDASALVAILLAEHEANGFNARILDADRVLTSPLAIFETTLALRNNRGVTLANAESDADALIRALAIEVIDITPEIGRLAIEARARYGKGTRHPARLNLGDCFSYACAKAHAVPLLYKGDDFVHTDLA